MLSISNYDEGTKHIIKDIFSSFIRAKAANADNNGSEELKHLLHAIQDMSVLLLRDLDEDTTTSYAASLVSSAIRAQSILVRGA